MAKMTYCWRCKIEVPMLDDREWEEIAPDLGAAFREINEYRRTHGVSLDEAKEQVFGSGVLRRYFEMTGFRETNVNAIGHHRFSLFGLPCSSCGKPLRTPQARSCAACGAVAEQLR